MTAKKNKKQKKVETVVMRNHEVVYNKRKEELKSFFSREANNG